MNKNKRAFTLVEVLIVTSIIMILAAISIPGAIRLMMNANEVNARSTLRIIIEAYESYAASHGGAYPDDFTDLIGDAPPYLNEDYTATPRRGYNFACPPLGAQGYQCTATPVACGRSGSKDFQISTGGIQSSQDCN